MPSVTQWLQSVLLLSSALHPLNPLLYQSLPFSPHLSLYLVLLLLQHIPAPVGQVHWPANHPHFKDIFLILLSENIQFKAKTVFPPFVQSMFWSFLLILYRLNIPPRSGGWGNDLSSERSSRKPSAPIQGFPQKQRDSFTQQDVQSASQSSPVREGDHRRKQSRTSADQVRSWDDITWRDKFRLQGLVPWRYVWPETAVWVEILSDRKGYAVSCGLGADLTECRRNSKDDNTCSYWNKDKKLEGSLPFFSSSCNLFDLFLKAVLDVLYVWICDTVLRNKEIFFWQI